MDASASPSKEPRIKTIMLGIIVSLLLSVDDDIPSASAYSTEGTGGKESAGQTLRFRTPATASRYETTWGDTSPTAAVSVRLPSPNNSLWFSPFDSLISFNKTSSSFEPISPFNLLHSMSDTRAATPMRSLNVVANECSGGDNAARAHSRKHLCTMLSSEDWIVPNALSGPAASCRKPRAERSASSDSVTFCGVAWCVPFGANEGPFATTPPLGGASPMLLEESSSVSRTISAP
mmetsp:Transcript_26082/g.47317  ORF Transcript_26082/g.47317 Transcript_26082/m.47317 type:complete len:234 (-) Transcript_26082:1734-2435(-)